MVAVDNVWLPCFNTSFYLLSKSVLVVLNGCWGKITKTTTLIRHDVTHPCNWKREISPGKGDKSTVVFVHPWRDGLACSRYASNKKILMPPFVGLAYDILQIDTAACKIRSLAEKMKDFHGRRGLRSLPASGGWYQIEREAGHMWANMVAEQWREG